MDKIRIGVIGAGWVVQNRNLPGLVGSPGVQLEVIWSKSKEKAREVAEKFRIPSVADGWREVASSPYVDAVVIGTPPILHCEATLLALKSGKHVLCQARMARNLSEARQMLEAARASNRVTILYPPRPGLKWDRIIRRWIREGRMGDIREVRVTSMALSDASTGYNWQTDPEAMGVNAMNLGIWAEVLNRWVGTATKVSALGKCHRDSRVTAQGETAKSVVPDSLTISAELKCGGMATYHLSNEAPFGPGHSIEIYGSKASLHHRFFPDDLSAVQEGGKEFEPVPIKPEEERGHTTDREFIDAIRSGGAVSPDFEEGIRYMEFSEAVASSLYSGKTVSLPIEPVMKGWGEPF